MKNTDYQRNKNIEFIRYIAKWVKKQHKSMAEYEQAQSAVDSLISQLGGELTGKLFHAVLQLVKLDIDIACQDLFSDYKLNALPPPKLGSSKLGIFISGVTRSEEDLAKAIGVSKTHFSNSKNDKDGEELFAYEIYALAILFNLKPSQLFEYFYGDGERPVIGLFPKPADGDASEG